MLFKTGDEVAVLSALSDWPTDLLEIANVKTADAHSVVLDDGRRFNDGVGINTAGYIVHVKRKHRAEMHRRLQSSNGEQPK